MMKMMMMMAANSASWGDDDIVEQCDHSLFCSHWTRILKSNQHKLNKVMYEILYYNLHFKDIHSSGWIKYINTFFSE